jgi:hypothetical protein
VETSRPAHDAADAARRKKQFNPSLPVDNIGADGCCSRSTVSMNRRAEGTFTVQCRCLHSCKYRTITRRYASRWLSGHGSRASASAQRGNQTRFSGLSVCIFSACANRSQFVFRTPRYKLKRWINLKPGIRLDQPKESPKIGCTLG